MTRRPGGEAGAEVLAARLEAHWPQEVRDCLSYVLWTAGDRPNGGVSKRPARLFGGRLEHISAFDVRGHLRFDQALDHLRRSGASGVGLVLQTWDGLVAVDLDRVTEEETLDDLGRGIVDDLDSYTEWSPSRRGIHVWVWMWGSLPENAAVRRGRVEVLRQGMITLTGEPLEGVPGRVRRRQRGLTSLYEQRVAHAESVSLVSSTTAAGDDAAVLKRALSAVNALHFRRLYCTTGLEGRSASEQDFRLALMLLYSTRGDVSQAKRLMLLAARRRIKWDQKASGGLTYLDWTIRNAARRHVGFGQGREQCIAVPSFP